MYLSQIRMCVVIHRTARAKPIPAISYDVRIMVSKKSDVSSSRQHSDKCVRVCAMLKMVCEKCKTYKRVNKTFKTLICVRKG